MQISRKINHCICFESLIKKNGSSIDVKLGNVAIQSVQEPVCWITEISVLAACCAKRNSWPCLARGRQWKSVAKVFVFGNFEFCVTKVKKDGTVWTFDKAKSI